MSQIKGQLSLVEAPPYEEDFAVDEEQNPPPAKVVVAEYNRLLKRVAHLEGAIKKARQNLGVLFMEGNAWFTVDRVRGDLVEALKEST